MVPLFPIISFFTCIRSLPLFCPPSWLLIGGLQVWDKCCLSDGLFTLTTPTSPTSVWPQPITTSPPHWAWVTQLHGPTISVTSFMRSPHMSEKRKGSVCRCCFFYNFERSRWMISHISGQSTVQVADRPKVSHPLITLLTPAPGTDLSNPSQCTLK